MFALNFMKLIWTKHPKSGLFRMFSRKTLSLKVAQACNWPSIERTKNEIKVYMK